jgi:hypothetical protein
MIYLRIIFHMSSNSDSIVTAIKPKAEYRFFAAAVLLFYSLQKNTFVKVTYFSKLCYTSFQDPV